LANLSPTLCQGKISGRFGYLQGAASRVWRRRMEGDAAAPTITRITTIIKTIDGFIPAR
jgi:hypothetical protein